MQEFRRQLIAEVEAELAELQEADDAVAAGLARRNSRTTGAGPSIVYSIRLACEEVTALERRAAARGLKPTVLARNMLRCGLLADKPVDVQTAELSGPSIGWRQRW